MAYDPRLKEVVLFGGDDGMGMNLGDTWAGNASAGWQRLTPPDGPKSARFGSAMAYDRRTHSPPLFGGEDANGGRERYMAVQRSDLDTIHVFRGNSTDPSSGGSDLRPVTWWRNACGVVLGWAIGACDTWLFADGQWSLNLW